MMDGGGGDRGREREGGGRKGARGADEANM